MIKTICKSEKTLLRHNIISLIILILILIIIVIIISNIKIYDKPKIDEMAQKGIPEVDEKYEYSILAINDGYEIGLCGNPNIENSEIDLYFTNMSNNDVWIKIQILNNEENVIGETGIIEPNKYIKSIKLKEEIEDTIKIKVVEYEIDTYSSKGCVNLKI